MLREKAARPCWDAPPVIVFSGLLENSKNKRKHTNGNREGDRQFLKFCLAARRFSFVGKGRGFAAERSAHAGAFRFLHQYNDYEQD
jgi:hypothetical protein